MRSAANAAGPQVAHTLSGHTSEASVKLLVALGLATLLGAKRPTAVATVVLTNPPTAGPAFTLASLVGRFLVPGPPLEEARHLVAQRVEALTPRRSSTFRAQLASLVSIETGFFLVFLAGGMMVTLLVFVPSDWLALWGKCPGSVPGRRGCLVGAGRSTTPQGPP